MLPAAVVSLIKISTSQATAAALCSPGSIHPSAQTAMSPSKYSCTIRNRLLMVKASMLLITLAAGDYQT
jgi:hypothetical protein